MSTNLGLAFLYMEIFYGNKNLQALNKIFHKDLHFEGPFFTFHAATDYIESLIKDPPIGCSYELIKSYEDEDSVLLLYEFRKGNIHTPMSQYFLIKEGKISHIQLVFNAKDFA